MEYDFKSLSYYDFELLCCDLFSSAWGKQMENFRQGRDKGIDLRYAGIQNEDTVVQCKHFTKSSFSILYKEMKNELPKVGKLQPARYILATSHFFTTGEKDKLFSLLQPFCKSTNDILGGNEINSLLRQHPDIEEAHHKLWLTSTAVLQKVLHSEVYRQSEFLQAELEEKLKLYVQSKTAFGKAKKVLDEFNCCIISGIPGIGKTTLAEILSIYYLDQGYQIIPIRSDIREAIKTYRPEGKQFFLYDDFLGSTTLEMKTNKNEGKELLSFLRHISRQKGKKFILTTREYILNQARLSYEEFARQDFDYNKCMISLEDYTKADRARILYNHLFFYHVPKDCIQDLLADGRIMEIIDHPNYSPRLIEAVTNLFHLPDSSRFYDFFMDTLSHPNKLWENAFRRQISPAARDLLLLLSASPRSVFFSDLKKDYEPYHRHKAVSENRSLSDTDFRDALKEAEGTFIKIDRAAVAYHNPSVRDFIQGYLRENDGEFRTLCDFASSFDSCIHLAGIDRKLSHAHKDAVLNAIRRTMDPAPFGKFKTIYIPGKQMINLSEANKELSFPEIQDMILNFIHQLPSWLEAERESLTEDNWHQKEEPNTLRDLLKNLSANGYKEIWDKEIIRAALEYALAWFEYSFVYSIEDFLLFCDLLPHHSCGLEKDRFSRVYEALEDYTKDLALGDIQEIDYESFCDDYRTDLESLENCFRVDLSSVKEMVEDRIFELTELENELEDNSNPFTDLVFQKSLDDETILDMFESLLAHDSEAESDSE